jgi:hypothetical protein
VAAKPVVPTPKGKDIELPPMKKKPTLGESFRKAGENVKMLKKRGIIGRRR